MFPSSTGAQERLQRFWYEMATGQAIPVLKSLKENRKDNHHDFCRNSNCFDFFLFYFFLVAKLLLLFAAVVTVVLVVPAVAFAYFIIATAGT